MDYGYQIAEAILNQYGIYKNPTHENVMDAAVILKELTNVTDDKWIHRAFIWMNDEFDLNDLEEW